MSGCKASEMSSVRTSSVTGISPKRGEYLWIHHSKDQRKDPTQRSKISSYIRHKQRQDAKSRDRLAQPPSNLSSPCEEENDSSVSKYALSRGPPTSMITEIESETSCLNVPEPTPMRQMIHGRVQQSGDEANDTGSLTILRRGNSDPFDSFAIPIDAKANELMLFLRSIIKMTSIEGGAARAHWFSYNWETSVSFLCDELTALAQLTHLACVMYPRSSRRSAESTQFLSYKSRSMALLRNRVAEGRTTEKNTYTAVYSLMLAENSSRNYPAAMIHSYLLVGLLQSGQILENFPFVFWTFSQDYQIAAMSQMRLCFDIKLWVPTFFQPFWNEVLGCLPSHELNTEVPSYMDGSIDDEKFSSVLLDIQTAHVALSVERTLELSNDESSRYCRAFWTWILARLHHAYLDAVEALEETQPPARNPHSTQTHVQAFFSLAAHCYMRVCVNVDSIKRGQVTVYDVNSYLLLKLRELLDDYERTAEPAQKLNYSKLQLWGLYVGSQAEQAADVQASEANAEYGWFNERFAKHARSMGLVVWQDVRAVLQEIHHSDSLRPHGSQWFWKTMNVNVDRD